MTGLADRILPIILAATCITCCAQMAQRVLVTSDSPPEAMLAALDQDTNIIEVSLITRYARILDQLDRRCTESRKDISSMAIAAVAELKTRYGIEGSSFQLLEEVVLLIKEGDLRGVRCQDAFAAVVVLIGERRVCWTSSPEGPLVSRTPKRLQSLLHGEDARLGL